MADVETPPAALPKPADVAAKPADAPKAAPAAAPVPKLTLAKAKEEHEQAKKDLDAITSKKLEKERIKFEVGPVDRKLGSLQQRIHDRMTELNAQYKAGNATGDVQELPELKAVAEQVADTREEAQIAHYSDVAKTFSRVLRKGGDLIGKGAGAVGSSLNFLYQNTLAPLVSNLKLGAGAKKMLKTVLPSLGLSATASSAATAMIDMQATEKTPEEDAEAKRQKDTLATWNMIVGKLRAYGVTRAFILRPDEFAEASATDALNGALARINNGEVATALAAKLNDKATIFDPAKKASEQLLEILGKVADPKPLAGTVTPSTTNPTPATVTTPKP